MSQEILNGIQNDFSICNILKNTHKQNDDGSREQYYYQVLFILAMINI